MCFNKYCELFNENSQLLSPWACWSRVGEFARVSFEFRSTTATAETARGRGRDSCQRMTTARAYERRRKRRGRKRKSSYSPQINNLPMSGSARKGEYDRLWGKDLAGHISLIGDILWLLILMRLITWHLVRVESLRHTVWNVVETVVCPPCWRGRGLAVCTNRVRLLKGRSQKTTWLPLLLQRLIYTNLHCHSHGAAQHRV